MRRWKYIRAAKNSPEVTDFFSIIKKDMVQTEKVEDQKIQ